MPAYGGLKTIMGWGDNWPNRTPCTTDPYPQDVAGVLCGYGYACGLSGLGVLGLGAAAATGPDWDGDGWEDGIDNCVFVANPLQEDRDIDRLGNVCEPDDDNDGHIDSTEAYSGTDSLDNCPDAAQHHAWPPDFDDDQRVDSSDVNRLAPPVFFSTAPGPPYQKRYDLEPDGMIDIADVNLLAPYFFTTCVSTESDLIDAVKATEQYWDVNVAEADGFSQVTQYIPNRGAYFINAARVDTVFDLKQPEGLIYGPGPGGWRLMGVFYLDPVWSDPNPPAGFTGSQDVWSVHNNFCIASDLTASENTSEAACGAAGGVWWAQMGHFLPAWLFRWNQAGVFQELNAAAN